MERDIDVFGWDRSFLALEGFLWNNVWLSLQSHRFLQCFSRLRYDQIFSLIGFRRSWRLARSWGSIVAEICAWRVFFCTTSSMQCLVLTGAFLLWPNHFNAPIIVFSWKCCLSVMVFSVWSLLYTALSSWDQHPSFIPHQAIGCLTSISSRFLSLFWQEDLKWMFSGQGSSVLNFSAS